MDQEKHEAMQNTIDQRQHAGSPSQKTAMPRWRSRGKEKSSIALACTWVVDHQISIAVQIISILFFTHAFFPAARRHTSKFFRISYYNPTTNAYALGWDDIFFVFYWIIVFSGMRCVVMDYLLTPVAAWAGIQKKKGRVRFAEQAWILIYDAGFWSTGMYIMYNSEYWLNLRALWKDWPIREMDGLAKWYYLVQFAFWLQQIVVVNIEERRKDHWQMFSHHIVTCALVFTSYGYHQTKVGNCILCLMDVVDLLLPLAKILKYLDFKIACDITFGVFMITWLAARHLGYMTVWWSIYKHTPEEINFGCYRGSVGALEGPFPTPNDWSHLIQPFRDPVGLVCWNNNIKWTFLGMLLALQIILLIWFVMIVKVAYKVLSGEGADDVRSDDEDDEDEEEEYEDEKRQHNDHHDIKRPEAFIDKVHTCAETHPLLEENTNTPNLDPDTTTDAKLKPSSATQTPVRRSSRRKPENGHSSSVNLLAGHSDRKDLLGRIGCDKGSGD